VASVAQLQTFRFIVRITAQVSFQVEYSLINGIWDEFENDQVLGGEYGRDLNAFPMNTRPMVYVTLPQTSRLLFYANPPGCHRDDEDCNDNDWAVLGENRREFTPGDARNLTPLEMDNLQSVMVMLWMCVKRIAAYPDKTV
jgi:hypothetical protein